MTTETTFAAHLLEGMGETREEPATMSDQVRAQLTRPLSFVPARIDVDRRLATGEVASAEEMRAAGWAMSYALDGYGRLFGRWPEGADPVALIPVREAA